MGQCGAKGVSPSGVKHDDTTTVNIVNPYGPTAATNHSPNSRPGSAAATPPSPKRIFKWPFPTPSLAKPLDKRFGYPKDFTAKFKLGKEVGRGHFGHTFWAKGKKGDLKNQQVAVKIISKSKMTSAILLEDVHREVKILKVLSGHPNLVKFYDAFEDACNVYIVMELCEGGELLDRILSRGGRYAEDDAKAIVVQILEVVAFCHLQGIIHRDLNLENFVFSTRDEDSIMKVIDFGLSDFIKPDERLNDIVGGSYHVAPEALHKSYSLEADIWSIGVITYILLSGIRPFWALTASGTFRNVLKADPNFEDLPWLDVSPEAKDFVKRMLNKDPRKRMSAAQALNHPWLRDQNRALPLDILVYKLVKSYIKTTPLKRAALKALSKALTEDELIYLRAQFNLLEPKEGSITLDNFRTALKKNMTGAMKESRVYDILNFMEPLSYSKMRFEEFCAAAISIYQLEAVEEWENISNTAFQHFEQEGNRVFSIEGLAQEMKVGPSAHSILKDWIRSSDGKLSFLGYTKFLHGLNRSKF